MAKVAERKGKQSPSTFLLLVYGQEESSAVFLNFTYNRLLKKWNEPVETEITFLGADSIVNCFQLECGAILLAKQKQTLLFDHEAACPADV